MTDSVTISSPLAWLADKRRARTLHASHALVVAFNANHGFFEKTVLGWLLAARCSVTVLSDLRVLVHDPRNARRAGRAYLPGVVSHHHAFHPKLVLLTSPERTEVMVGSGNLTDAGWYRNDEVWSLHTGSPDDTDPVIAGVADWLTALPNTVAVSAGVPAALAAIAERIAGHGAAPDPTAAGGGYRFVHNLNESLLSQFPAGPVDDLYLYAPFHDPSARAVEAIIERLQPAAVTVGYQPNETIVNGPRVIDALGAMGETIALEDSPYRHGKMIEWTAGGDRWSYTGSANLSMSALLSTAEAGNVEIGVLGPQPVSLRPPPTAREEIEPLAEIVRHTRDSDADAVSVPGVVFWAERTQGWVTVAFTRPPAAGSVVQVRLRDPATSDWDTRADCPDGAVEVVFPGDDITGGSWVRVLFADETASNVVPVSHPAMLRRAARTGGGRGQDRDAVEPLDIFDDPDANAHWFKMLNELARSLGDTKGSDGAGGGQGGDGGRIPGPVRFGNWKDHLDDQESVLGQRAVNYALGFPLGRLDDDSGSDVDDDNPEGLDGEDAGTELEGTNPNQVPTGGPGGSRDAEERRARARRAARTRMLAFTTSSTDRLRALPPLSLNITIRQLLFMASDGLVVAEELPDALLGLLDGLDADPIETDLQVAIGSLAAVGLHVVSGLLDPNHRTGTHTRFDQVAERLSTVVLAADEDRVSEFCTDLAGPYSEFAHPRWVMEFAERFATSDPLALAVAAATDVGIDADLVDRTVQVYDDEDVDRAAFYIDASLKDRQVCWAIKGPQLMFVWEAPLLYSHVEGNGWAIHLYKHGSPGRGLEKGTLPRGVDTDEVPDSVTRFLTH